MTELAGLSMDPATEAANAPLPPARSYWGVVMSSFWAAWMSRLAMLWVVFLLALTVAVPFIANGQPFTIEMRSGGGAMVRSYPLFSTLSNIDLSLLVFAGVVVLFLTCRAWIRRRAIEEDRKRSFVFGIGLTLLILGTSATVLLFCLHTPYSAAYDYRDYQAMLKDKSADGAYFTLIPWHYADMEPLQSDRTNQYPSADHWLGTDSIGRDALSRLLWSTRVIMGIGFISQGIALVFGVFAGALIGYCSGKVDLLGMRCVEVFESIPTFFLILIFIAIYGRQIFMIMVILGLVGWTGIARFLRAEFLRLRGMDFVQAAIAEGLPLRRVLFRHMLPNGLTPVIVIFTFGVAGAIMSESGLSFLGVGVEPPIPSWGQMLNDAGGVAVTFRWWLAMPPGLMIFLTVLAYNVIGEGMRDALDPRVNKKL